MPNKPTSKQDLIVHAARLREIAEAIRAEVDALRPLCDPSALFDCEERDAAALLAGAEAITEVDQLQSLLETARQGMRELGAALEAEREAVEVAKAALVAEAWKIGNGTPTMDGKSFYRILSNDQHAVATAYKAALARLEGE